MGELGGVAGRLYAWNTIGSLLGALLGGYALLFVIDLPQVFALALGAILVGAGILSVLLLRLPVLAVGLVTAAGLGACLLLPEWGVFRMNSGLSRQRTPLPQTYSGADALFASRGEGARIAFHDDDPTSTIVVIGEKTLSLMTNAKSDGNLPYDYTTMAFVGLVPALLSDDPSRAFVIGWGLGTTAGVLGALDDVHEVVVAEISPAVLAAAPLFDAGNQNASKNPKIHAIRSDAYRALLRSEGQFGVIAEPSNLGDGRRDALQRGVPARRPRPPDARRRLRPVVPSLRDGRRNHPDRPAHLPGGLRGHGDLVHPERRHPAAGIQGSVPGPGHRRLAGAVRARRISRRLPEGRGRQPGPAAGPRDRAARGGGCDRPGRSHPHPTQSDPERQRGPRILHRRDGDPASHALGGSQPGGRSAPR
jgi:hypothetical protein